MAEPCGEVDAGRNRHKRSVCNDCSTCFGCESASCAAADGSGKRHKKSEGDPSRRPVEEKPQRMLPPRAATDAIQPGTYAEKREMIFEFEQQPAAVGDLFAALGLDSPGRKFAFLDEVNSNRQLQEIIGLLERTTMRCAEIIHPAGPDIIVQGAAQNHCGHTVGRDAQLLESLARTVINSPSDEVRLTTLGTMVDLWPRAEVRQVLETVHADSKCASREYVPDKQFFGDKLMRHAREVFELAQRGKTMKRNLYANRVDRHLIREAIVFVKENAVGTKPGHHRIVKLEGVSVQTTINVRDMNKDDFHSAYVLATDTKHARISEACAAEVLAYQELTPAAKQKQCPPWRIGRELFMQVLDAICVKSLAKACLSYFLTDFVSSTKLLEDVATRICEIYNEYHVPENIAALDALQRELDPSSALDVRDLLAGGAVQLVEKVCEHGRHGYYCMARDRPYCRNVVDSGSKRYTV